MGISISVTLAGLSRLYPDGLQGILETGRVAEEVGIGQIAVTDHVVIGTRTDEYPYGSFPFPNEEPWPEPLIVLAAIAGATRRLRLATGILIAPLRPAALLAKTLATLDVMSGGRVDIGVGTGWQSEEYDAAGVPFRGRASRMDDTLRACRALWTQAPASFESDSVTFKDLWSFPRPVEPAGIPLWLGLALTDRNLTRFTEFDAGWMPMTSDPAELADGIHTLRRSRVEAGLDPDMLQVRANAPVVSDQKGHPDLDRTLDGLGALAEIGVTQAAFALPRFVRRAADIPAFLETLGQRARQL
ncbi:MAG: TIGR03619 family F420-dependent LLM class oxidoreductase [Myxococcota bacterium]